MEQANRLLLVCVETNSKSKTDVFYINKILQTIYVIDNETKIDYVYLDGKHKYKNKTVLDSIRKKSKNFANIHIIYCIDTDDIFTNPKHIALNEEISQYCAVNNYDLVWFCRNVEEVFLGKIIKDKDKVKEAKKFGALKEIDNSIIKSLDATIQAKRKSNLMLVFNNYFKKIMGCEKYEKENKEK
ncbi:MAG: hypothetical protein J5656_04645 [Clostridia bacterium]|nr:hypothetical protein [Clostridia bacterium]